MNMVTNLEDLKLHQNPLPKQTGGRTENHPDLHSRTLQSHRSPWSSVHLWNRDRVNEEEEETAKIWGVGVQVS